MPNDVNDAGFWKKFEPARSKEGSSGLFPTPQLSQFQPGKQPEASRILSVAEDGGKFATNILSQVFGTMLPALRRLHPLQESSRLMPRRAESVKILFMQALKSTRFLMAVQALADLKPEKPERASGGSGAGAVGTDDEDGRTLPSSLHNKPGAIHGLNLAHR
jgi:hypothetical protein